MLRFILAIFVAAVLAGTAIPAMATTLPAWVQSQLTAPVPDHDAKTAAVILYSDTAIAVRSNGSLHRVVRRVIKILRPEGIDYGIIRADADSQSRITGMHGWNVAPGAPPVDVDEREVVESGVLGVQEGNLVDDVRTKLLRIPAVVPGNIIAYEYSRDLQPYMLADDWVFQDEIPVRESHYSLELPSGWSYKAHWINHADTPATTSGNRTLWMLTDLKAIRGEPQMPPWEAISGRLALSLVPPGGHGQGFDTWSDVGAWYLNLAKTQMASSASIKQQVAMLTAAQPSLLGKIQALANFVQSDVRYVAIELGIGGFQPHAAADVFTHRYGDCKDKSTLLATMLKEIGVDANYVIVNSERGAISDSTPPNLGFDHVILAIQLPAGIESPTLLAIATQEKLGRILYFDPTDTYTPLGTLSGPLQDGFGLLVTADGSKLVHLPVMPIATNGLRRTGHLTLDASGALRGDVMDTSFGDTASIARSAVETRNLNTDQIKPIESLMSGSFPTFTLTSATIRNLRAHDQPLEWHYNFEVPRFAEASGDLLTLRPCVLGTKASGLLETKEARANDIEFDGLQRDTDAFEITLPPSYAVDDIPQPLDLDYPFASYHSKTEVTGHVLRYTRSFEIKQVSVPVSQAAQLKDLYRAILNDERALVVLHRAAGG
ncbi:MAG TPA: DUF3857 and transglutaminase domain-containing protein [Steroidobacteraceae bacterium]|nr:DUF3857 and transglutaminase domain-containing protein [Steroidobacteraceae bacterium]